MEIKRPQVPNRSRSHCRPLRVYSYENGSPSTLSDNGSAYLQISSVITKGRDGREARVVVGMRWQTPGMVGQARLLHTLLSS